MDAQYDVRRWVNEPLTVHFVPFSHNDPGMLVIGKILFAEFSSKHQAVYYMLCVERLNHNAIFIAGLLCWIICS